MMRPGDGSGASGGSQNCQSDSGPGPAPLHQRLRACAAGLTQDRVSVAELAQSHGTAARGTLMVLLAAPCMLPVPGVGTVLGLGLAMMALAMWRDPPGAGLRQLFGQVIR